MPSIVFLLQIRARGQNKFSGSAGLVYYLDCGDAIMGTSIYKSHQNVYIKYLQFFVY